MQPYWRAREQYARSRLGNKYTDFISFITNRRESPNKKEKVHEIQEEASRNLLQANLLLKDQSRQQVEEIEALRQQIDQLNLETREKDRIIQEKEATIQLKEAIITENKRKRRKQPSN